MRKTIVTILAAWFATMACATISKTLPRLPDGTLPNAEVTTNIPLNVNFDRLRECSFRIEAPGGSANEILLAVGHDADGNGDLSFDESDFVFGRDCGQYYLINYILGQESTDIADTLTINYRHFNREWDLMKVVKRGTGSVGETISLMFVSNSFVITVR